MTHGPHPGLTVLVPADARHVLEVGCGGGHTGALIKARLPHCQVMGVERDPRLAGEARARLDAVVDAVSAGLPFRRASFDAILVPHALTSTLDPLRLLRDVRNLLRPGGLLIAAAPAARNVQALQSVVAPPPIQVTESQCRYTREALAQLATEAGYDLTWLRAEPDPSAPPTRPFGPTNVRFGRVVLLSMSPAEMEELSAREFLLCASPRPGERPRCSIVVADPHLERALACVAAIRRAPPRESHEILVVTARPAAEVDRASASESGVRVLANPVWIGRAAARNQGARHARGEFLVFLDGDGRPGHGWLDALIDAAFRRAHVAVVGSKVVARDGTIVHAGVALGERHLPAQTLPYLLYRHADGEAPYVNRERFMLVADSGLLVSREAFVAIGGFDEGYRTFLADADFCLVARGRLLKSFYCPGSVIERDIAPGPEADPEDVAYFLRRWAGGPVADEDPVQRDGTDLATAYGVVDGGSAAVVAPHVVWTGDLLDLTGYGEEARSFLFALDRAGVSIQANPANWRRSTALLPEHLEKKLSDLIRLETPDGFVHVIHLRPTERKPVAGLPRSVEHAHFRRHPRASRHIGRTTFETDRIPASWVGPCNEMDEIWVPSAFNVETFARSGVAREKLHVVPEPLAVDPFDPWVPPLPLPGVAGFVFLSLFGWRWSSWRKGWDVTVRAFLEEFDRREAVTLVFHLATRDVSAQAYQAEIDRFVREDLGREPDAGPPIVIFTNPLSTTDLVRLYRAADAFVLATRGEGFGRPFMEAMAVGLPVIGTRWSGHLDFMHDDNSYLIDCDMVDVPERMWREFPLFRGHRCAEPSVPHLRQLMRRVLEERGGEAAARGRRAQREILEGHSWSRVASIVNERLRSGSAARPRASGHDRRGSRDEAKRVAVAWEGPQFVHLGMAVVNRNLCRQLLASGDVDLTLVSDRPGRPGAPEDASLAACARRDTAGDVDVHVRHQWPPDFTPPPHGRWVLIQPWEFGSFPRSWIEPINRLVDEVWVPTQYVRAGFLRSGIDPQRVAVIPNGVDADRFHPGAPPRPLPTRKRFRFLFVGGTLPRKGSDILVETYLSTFRAEDDVCLVIKDMGTASFYRGQTLRDRIGELAQDPGHPEILYLDQDLEEDALAGLYTACHSLVHPYRGEGFGLPILEAMACGLPVIVPDHGAALDFCDLTTAYLVPATEVRLPEARVGELETVDRPWLAEVDRNALAAAMRRVVENPEEARERGRLGSERVRREFTWAQAAQKVRVRLHALADAPNRRETAHDPTDPATLEETGRVLTALGAIEESAQAFRAAEVFRHRSEKGIAVVPSAPAGAPRRAVDARRPRVLLVTCHLPQQRPLTGTLQRLEMLLGAFQQIADVTLFHPQPDDEAAGEPLGALMPAHLEAAANAAARCWNLRRHRPTSLTARAFAACRPATYDVVFMHRLYTVWWTGWTDPTRTIVDVDDLPSQSFRQAVDPNGGKRASRWLRYRRLRLSERRMPGAFRFALVCSEADQRYLGHPHVEVLPNVYWPHPLMELDPRPGDGTSLLYVGTLGYRPNLDGLAWFVRDVWPYVRRQRPEVTLTVVGHGGSRQEGDWSWVGAPGVRFVGSVADVGPSLRAADLSICPVWQGRGTRVKILESLAFAKPVVSTTVGAHGLPMDEARGLFRRDDGVSFAEACLSLLADPTRRVAVGTAGRAAVRARFSPAQLTAKLHELLERILGERGLVADR